MSRSCVARTNMSDKVRRIETYLLVLFSCKTLAKRNVIQINNITLRTVLYGLTVIHDPRGPWPVLHLGRTHLVQRRKAGTKISTRDKRQYKVQTLSDILSVLIISCCLIMWREAMTQGCFLHKPFSTSSCPIARTRVG